MTSEDQAASDKNVIDTRLENSSPHDYGHLTAFALLFSFIMVS